MITEVEDNCGVQKSEWHVTLL